MCLFHFTFSNVCKAIYDRRQVVVLYWLLKKRFPIKWIYAFNDLYIYLLINSLFKISFMPIAIFFIANRQFVSEPIVLGFFMVNLLFFAEGRSVPHMIIALFIDCLQNHQYKMEIDTENNLNTCKSSSCSFTRVVL